MLEPTEFAVTTHMYHMNTKPCVAGLTLFPRFNSSKIDAKSDVCSVHVAGVFQRIFSSALRKQPCQRSQNLQRVYEVTDPHRRAHKTLRMRKSIEKPQRTSPERRTGETADATGAAHSLGAHFDAPWSGSGRPAHAPAAPRPAKHTGRARPAQIHVRRPRARRVTSTHATLGLHHSDSPAAVCAESR